MGLFMALMCDINGETGESTCPFEVVYHNADYRWETFFVPDPWFDCELKAMNAVSYTLTNQAN